MSASMAQMELGELRPAQPSPLDLRFAILSEEHPEVLPALVALARTKLARQRLRGRTPGFSAKALVEALRWAEDDDGAAVLPPINNSLVSRFARAIAETAPDLADFMDLRQLNS